MSGGRAPSKATGGGASVPVEPGRGTDGDAGPIPETSDGGTIKGTRGDDTLKGTDGDDLIKGRKGDDTLTTGAGKDTVRGGKGNDTITVDGSGDKKINGGKGHDTLELQGQASDYAAEERQNGSTVYTAADGSRIVARNIESVCFVGGGTDTAPADPNADIGMTQAIGEDDGDFTPDTMPPIGGPPQPGGDVDPVDPVDPDDTMATTLAIGEEDGGSDDPGNVPPIGDQTSPPGVEPAPTPPTGEDTPPEDGDISPFVPDFPGTDGDDTLTGTDADENFETGQGTDTVNAGGGDDRITITGTGSKTIDGGAGSDTVVLKGTADNYAATANADGSTVYTANNGSEINVRSVETIVFADGPPDFYDFTAFYGLAPNDIGATTLEVTGNTATLTGPNTNFTFTGVDPSGLAFDGPIVATGGSGTINGVETTAVAGAGSDAVLQISSGFNPTGTQSVSATFADGQTLDTTVAGVSAP